MVGQTFSDESLERKGVTGSGLVYLFREKFLHQAWSGGFVHAQPDWLSPADRRNRVLAIRLFETALLSLAVEEFVSLVVEKRKWLVFAWNVVTISKKKRGDDLPPSLERAIMNVLRPTRNWRGAIPKPVRVKAVVKRVIWEERVDPWEWVVHHVKMCLAETGYLIRTVERLGVRPYYFDKKILWTAHEEAVTPLVEEAETLNASVGTFTSTNRDLHKRLVNEVADGIAAQDPPASD